MLESVSTKEASRVLNVLEQFLISLLDGGKIPFHMEGCERRIPMRDLLAYKTQRDLTRRRILDNMARAEFEAGTYDQVPDDFKQS
ncbi:MAG: helix-turn-helix domain-containing protein [Candidatus Sulfotelmatobacter sp.]